MHIETELKTSLKTPKCGDCTFFMPTKSSDKGVCQLVYTDCYRKEGKMIVDRLDTWLSSSSCGIDTWRALLTDIINEQISKVFEEIE